MNSSNVNDRRSTINRTHLQCLQRCSTNSSKSIQRWQWRFIQINSTLAVTFHTNQFNVGSDVSYKSIQRRQWRFIQIDSTSAATFHSIRQPEAFKIRPKMILSKLTDSDGFTSDPCVALEQMLEQQTQSHDIVWWWEKRKPSFDRRSTKGNNRYE